MMILFWFCWLWWWWWWWLMNILHKGNHTSVPVCYMIPMSCHSRVSRVRQCWKKEVFLGQSGNADREQHGDDGNVENFEGFGLGLGATVQQVDTTIRDSSFWAYAHLVWRLSVQNIANFLMRFKAQGTESLGFSVCYFHLCCSLQCCMLRAIYWCL